MHIKLREVGGETFNYPFKSHKLQIKVNEFINYEDYPISFCDGIKYFTPASNGPKESRII